MPPPSTVPRPAGRSARRPETAPSSLRRRPPTAPRPRPPAGTAAGPACPPSLRARRRPWPRRRPPARPLTRRSRGGRAVWDRLSARPRHRTRPHRRAGSWPPSTRTYVPIGKALGQPLRAGSGASPARAGALSPSLGGLHLAPESRRLPLAVRELRLLAAQRFHGLVHAGTGPLFARRRVGELPLQALELPARLCHVSPLRGPGLALRRRADRKGAERRGRSLALDPASEHPLAQLRVARRGPERLGDQLEGTLVHGMAGIACGAFGDVDDRPGSFALSGSGVAPCSGSLVLALERPALGVLELPACLGELLELRR